MRGLERLSKQTYEAILGCFAFFTNRIFAHNEKQTTGGTTLRAEFDAHLVAVEVEDV
jgi:hypothetical protein